jgi:hypothetical protein
VEVAEGVGDTLGPDAAPEGAAQAPAAARISAALVTRHTRDPVPYVLESLPFT